MSPLQGYQKFRVACSVCGVVSGWSRSWSPLVVQWDGHHLCCCCHLCGLQLNTTFLNLTPLLINLNDLLYMAISGLQECSPIPALKHALSFLIFQPLLQTYENCPYLVAMASWNEMSNWVNIRLEISKEMNCRVNGVDKWINPLGNEN